MCAITHLVTRNSSQCKRNQEFQQRHRFLCSRETLNLHSSDFPGFTSTQPMSMIPEELFHPLLQSNPHPRNARGLRADSQERNGYISNERTFYGQTTLLPPPNLARVRAGRTASPSPGLTSASSSRPITSTVIVDRHGKRKKRIPATNNAQPSTTVDESEGGPSGSNDTLVIVRREEDPNEQVEAESSVGQLPGTAVSAGRGGVGREERLRRARARAAEREARQQSSSGTREGGLVRAASMRRVNVQESESE